MVENKIVGGTVHPLLMPRGWKGDVAKLLGVHRNTVDNALRARKGANYNRLMHLVKEKYGIDLSKMYE